MLSVAYHRPHDICVSVHRNVYCTQEYGSCCALNNCIPTASPTPSNRQLLSSNTPTTATITWDSVDNAVSYTVRSTSLQSPVTGIEEESYTLTGLELETDYTLMNVVWRVLLLKTSLSGLIYIQGLVCIICLDYTHAFLYSSRGSKIR